MATFLIEIPHSEKIEDCKKVINVFLSSGSHVISHAHWGCKDGVHKLWFIYDFDDKAQALLSVPPMMRADAKITELVQFKPEDVMLYAEE